MTARSQTHAIIDYEDDYVQPLLLQALQDRLPPEVLVLMKSTAKTSTPRSPLLQWRQYESIDFEGLLSSTDTWLANSYIIRKALIRKHYLSATVTHWLSKHSNSLLRKHVKPSIEFELDYSEFLDDALVEAFELRESFARNADKDAADREWWILKPGMSDRGQGIRLFSTEEELTEIFEAWDPPSDDENDDDAASKDGDECDQDGRGNGVMTSHLRHFVAQPYIHPPLLMSLPHPSANRKFHIRTYVLAVGALKVYVYKPMLALFAGQPYRAPSHDSNEDLQSHLTNTCLQDGTRDGSVSAFWSLPKDVSALTTSGLDWRETVFQAICDITGEIFEAAARSMSIHFQPLPNAFELFGIDFMVDETGNTWLLEVNAFPDFAQTGGELRQLIKGLLDAVVDVAVKPFFQISTETQHDDLRKVLDIDLGRR